MEAEDHIDNGYTVGVVLKNVARFIKKYKMKEYDQAYRTHCISVYLWGVVTKRIDWSDVGDLRDWGFVGASSFTPPEEVIPRDIKPNYITRRADSREERMRNVERAITEKE